MRFTEDTTPIIALGSFEFVDDKFSSKRDDALTIFHDDAIGCYHLLITDNKGIVLPLFI
ncbi:hypothetical protein [[Flexibacter] sp. ATCC 35208]|uniref:hypothetical protein n=1 Tax=[Flexibacter] sp. ATCC 35208 TaxID=1936242 RepID=UPI0015C3C0BB|nr:hypothetical protein [[Flexibacter] sp. ATCC 35208]